MAYETYNEVLTLVKSWSNRRDLTDDQFYNFIFFAGNFANQVLRVPAMENTEILSTLVDGQVVIPFDFLELRSLTANFDTEDSVPLERVAWDQYVNYVNDPNAQNETQPRYFSRQGAFWFITPVPEENTQITCHYYRALPDISVSEPTNWLIQLSPMTYLFGALHYLYLFLMDDERAQYWQTKFIDELTRIQELASNAEYKGTSLTVRARNPSAQGEI